MRKVSIDEVVADVRRVAALLDIRPSEVSHKNMSDHGHYGHDVICKVGGIKTLRKLYFETGKNPNADTVDSKIVRQSMVKLRNQIADQDWYRREIAKAVNNMKEVKVKPYVPKKRSAVIDRAIVAMQSDQHIGSDLRIEEVGANYGVVEEARSMAYVTKNICDYKMEYRDNTRLIVPQLGDLIENHLHPGGGGDLLFSGQFPRALHLLIQQAMQFASNFAEVDIYCTSGNHGRDKGIHPTKAVEQRYNSIEYAIYAALKEAMRLVPNVNIHIPKTQYLDFRIFNHRMFAAHGDGVFSIGNPGKKVDTFKVEAVVNKINASLKDKDEYVVWMAGHMHQYLSMILGSGCQVILNGTTVPPNAFSRHLNIIENQQVQVMFEATKRFPVGDLRAINATGSATDASLDKIIAPWEGV